MNKRVKLKTTFAAAMTAAMMSMTASAAPFQNGSFEEGQWSGGTISGVDFINGILTNWINFAPGATSITGWEPTTIDTSWHDLTTTGLAQNGTYVVDLVGSAGQGGIQQTFDTVVGTTYTVSFYMSAHQLLAGRTMDAPFYVAIGEAGSLTPQVNNYTVPAAVSIVSPSNAWTQQSFNYTATATSTTLHFYTDSNFGGTVSGCCGPMIDNVSVTAQPLPPVITPSVPVPTAPWAWLLALALPAITWQVLRGRARSNTAQAKSDH